MTTAHPPISWQQGAFSVTTDIAQLDIPAIHAYLTRSSWAEGIDIGTVRMAVSNSLSFGLFEAGKQIGFARLATDFATFGYLCDVYVLEEYQHQGLGRWLVSCCQAHPLMARLRKIMLVTTTAPWLYQKFGYQPVNLENTVWQIARPDIYKQSGNT